MGKERAQRIKHLVERSKAKREVTQKIERLSSNFKFLGFAETGKPSPDRTAVIGTPEFGYYPIDGKPILGIHDDPSADEIAALDVLLDECGFFDPFYLSVGPQWAIAKPAARSCECFLTVGFLDEEFIMVSMDEHAVMVLEYDDHRFLPWGVFMKHFEE